MTTNINTTIEELEKDITYFTNLGFNQLVEKFKRDLTAIKELKKEMETGG